MMSTLIRSLVPLALIACLGCGRAQEAFDPTTIIAMEQAALERWGKGDPNGYLEIMAPSVTYFDPTTERRVDTRAKLEEMLAPLRGQISIERAEMIGPSVERNGDTAVLTFNLISHGGRLGNGPRADVRWNSTEIYRRIDGQWRIVHSHWSLTKPEIKQPAV